MPGAESGAGPFDIADNSSQEALAGRLFRLAVPFFGKMRVRYSQRRESAIARTNTRTTPDPGAVLTRAVVRSASLLGLNDATLAAVIGVSPATVSRCRGGTAVLNPDRKPGQLARLLIRVFRALDPLVGGNDDDRKAWMQGRVAPLHGTPAQLILSPDGLVRTLAYLDGMRALA